MSYMVTTHSEKVYFAVTGKNPGGSYRRSNRSFRKRHKDAEWFRSQQRKARPSTST